ncbi:MAG TPA: hypothetical protein PK805_00270 [Acidovorax temperans]|jgi:hypothetical protein|nr:hypothetical protein [Acidovorax temperans]
MSQKTVVFGLTVNAYASASVQIEEGASRNQVIAAVRARYTQLQDELVFDPDWSTGTDFRMVCAVGDSALSELIDGVPIDPPLVIDLGDGDLDGVIHQITTVAAHADASVQAALGSSLTNLKRLRQVHGNLRPNGGRTDEPVNVEVRHWGCYGLEGTRNTHVISLNDQRGSSGQVRLDIGGIDGDVDDMLCLTAEIGTHPKNGIDQVPCVHVNFDSDNLAMSIFKVGPGLIVQTETGTFLGKLDPGSFLLLPE